MKYLYTSKEHYRLYVERNNTDRLSKNCKLYTTSKDKLLNDSKLYEIFKNSLYTDYQTYIDNNHYKFIFKSNSNTEYRLDIFIINESDKGLVNHIAFSLNSRNLSTDEYETPTDKKEMIEVLNRLHFIIKDLVYKQILTNYFCIGGTELESKNNIYQYMLKVIVGDDGFEKIETNIYDTEWGLYFKIF